MAKRKHYTIGKIGSCYDCKWREEDFKKDVCRLAREHAKKYGHHTNVEVVRSYDYNQERK